MILKRIYDETLAQASYLVGCEATREAIVIDPNRDAHRYVDAAKRERLRIVAVTETHIHADFLSGSRELARMTGATLLLSGEGGRDWQYGFARESGARLLHDGDTIDVGRVRIEVRHTPGHTPEHITFVVTDTATAATPIGAFTGDFIFVGDVGRPDLLERAAGVEGTMERGARDLYRSIQRFLQLPDHLQIWPGHGAGSACGKALGALPQSTLGYERIANWALAPQSESDFVARVLSGQPEPPTYFARMKRLNRDGPPSIEGLGDPPLLADDELHRAIESGAMVIDTRQTARFAERHVPCTINIPANSSFATWMGWFVSYDAPFYLIADEHASRHAMHALRLIGLDNIAGIFSPSAVEHAPNAERTHQVSTSALAPRIERGDVQLIDVRGSAEFAEGHIPGAINIPLGHLPSRLDELDAEKPVVLQCAGGTRSSIAASIALARGVGDVMNLTGGYGAWVRESRETSE